VSRGGTGGGPATEGTTANGNGAGVGSTAGTSTGGGAAPDSGVTGPGNEAATGNSIAAEADGGGASVTALVDLLTERALALSVQAPRAPSSVRISAGEVRVEICWPAGPPGLVDQAVAAARYAIAAQAAQAPAGIAGHAGEIEGQAPVTTANGSGGHGTAAHPAAPADTFPLCAGTVGTFYRAPEPGAAPFVAEGDTVRAGQQVAIIEAMKLMIPVEAEQAGVVVEFLVADRAPVEYGQPLIRLREAGQ
jgi:acetyl-CoA carboxylase biotin carboxyl carrier protein